MSQAITELKKIIEMEDTQTKLGFRRRQDALDTWIKRWVSSIYEYQDVVDTKNLPSGYKDALVYKIAQDLLLTLVEDCIKIDIKRRKIIAELFFLTKRPKQ